MTHLKALGPARMLTNTESYHAFPLYQNFNLVINKEFPVQEKKNWKIGLHKYYEKRRLFTKTKEDLILSMALH